MGRQAHQIPDTQAQGCRARGRRPWEWGDTENPRTPSSSQHCPIPLSAWPISATTGNVKRLMARTGKQEAEVEDTLCETVGDRWGAQMALLQLLLQTVFLLQGQRGSPEGVEQGLQVVSRELPCHPPGWEQQEGQEWLWPLGSTARGCCWYWRLLLLQGFHKGVKFSNILFMHSQLLG